MSLPTYVARVDSGLTWLGQVPKHWSTKRLRYVAELNPSKSELAERDRSTEVSFLPMEAIGDDGSLSLEHTRTVAEVETGYTYFRDGDVIIAKITPCFENGKGALVHGLRNGIGFGTTELIVARPRPTEVSGSFLNWLFRSPNFRNRAEASMYGAGGQKRVPDDFVRNFAWAFPPLAEQAGIAVFLDRETAKTDALIAGQQKLIALLAEKRCATISHAVIRGLSPDVSMKESGVAWLGRVPAHWEVGSIKRFFTNLDGKRIPLSAEERGLRPGTYPYYGASGVIDSVDDYIFNEDLILVSEDGANLLSRSTPIAFIATGAYWVNNHAHILKPPDENLVFWAERIEALDLAPVVTGSAQPKLTVEALMNLVISAPPTVEERAAIAAFISTEAVKLDALTANVDRTISLLKERRGALIAAVVSGQIDVRDGVAQAAPLERIAINRARKQY